MGMYEAYVALGVVLIVFAFISGTILMAIKLIKGGASSKGQKANADESRMIQEIYQGMARMEERVESLETILLERERARKERGENGRV